MVLVSSCCFRAYVLVISEFVWLVLKAVRLLHSSRWETVICYDFIHSFVIYLFVGEKDESLKHLQFLSCYVLRIFRWEGRAEGRVGHS